ncbi:MAG: hypothetical protein IKE66_14985 [Hyphomicrobium sp.]|nr:hypothetical protein [Hyphomicrobium sp.]
MDQSKVAETFLARQDKARSFLLRPMIDAAAAFALLCILSLSLGIGPTSASPQMPPPTASYAMTAAPVMQKATTSAGDRHAPIEIATTSSANSANAVYGRTSIQAAWILLLLSTSAIIALNLALYRHIRTAYTPRRRRNPME